MKGLKIFRVIVELLSILVEPISKLVGVIKGHPDSAIPTAPPSRDGE